MRMGISFVGIHGCGVGLLQCLDGFLGFWFPLGAKNKWIQHLMWAEHTSCEYLQKADGKLVKPSYSPCRWGTRVKIQAFLLVIGEQVCICNHAQSKLSGKDLSFNTACSIKLVRGMETLGVGAWYSNGLADMLAGVATGCNMLVWLAVVAEAWMVSKRGSADNWSLYSVLSSLRILINSFPSARTAFSDIAVPSSMLKRV